MTNGQPTSYLGVGENMRVLDWIVKRCRGGPKELHIDLYDHLPKERVLQRKLLVGRI